MREVDILLKGVLIGTSVLTVLLLVSTPLTEWGTARIGRALDMNQNNVGRIFVYAALISLTYTKKTKLYYILFAVFSVVLMFTGSRTAFVLLLFVVVFFFFSKVKKGTSFLYLIPISALILTLLYFSMNSELLYNVLGSRMEGLLNFFSEDATADHSTRIRMELIGIGFELFKDNVLIGYGIDTFRHLNDRPLYSHNNYIELLVNFGLIGTVIYYGFYLSLLFRSAYSLFAKKIEIMVLPVSLIIMILVADVGTVSYFSAFPLILIAISYKIYLLNRDTPDITDQPDPVA